MTSYQGLIKNNTTIITSYLLNYAFYFQVKTVISR